jgi:hypothetical protein
LGWCECKWFAVAFGLGIVGEFDTISFTFINFFFNLSVHMAIQSPLDRPLAAVTFLATSWSRSDPEPSVLASEHV